MLNRMGERLATVLVLSFILLAPFIQPPWLLAVMVVLCAFVMYLIPRTRLLSVALVPIAILFGLSILSLFVFSCTLAILVTGEVVFHGSSNRIRPYIAQVVSGLAACLLVSAYLGTWAPLVVIFGIVVAVLLKAILRRREDTLMIEALGVAMTMFLIDELNYSADLALIAFAVVIAFSFGYFSYRTGTADVSGLFSGALIGIILIVFGDIRWFIVMLAFFILGSASTKYMWDYKLQLGIEQPRGGARGYLNVFANGSVSAASAVLWGVSGSPVFLALFLGSVATAAADTVASEIGVTGGEPYLITTFEKVSPGTNGGVSLKGELVSLASALTISLTALALGIVDVPVALAGTLGGFIGTNIDSLVGALLENPGYVGNAGTNFIATLGGGVASVAIAVVLWSLA
ncbi:MAG: TIGR00297 family protein [Methanolinea sp.]|nr:TIGR00297 family protein [Methanolinea sp.]